MMCSVFSMLLRRIIKSALEDEGAPSLLSSSLWLFDLLCGVCDRRHGCLGRFIDGWGRRLWRLALILHARQTTTTEWDRRATGRNRTGRARGCRRREPVQTDRCTVLGCPDDRVAHKKKVERERERRRERQRENEKGEEKRSTKWNERERGGEEGKKAKCDLDF